MSEMLNKVAETAVEAIAENKEAVKVVGLKTVILFGAGCAVAGAAIDETVRCIVKAIKSKKSTDLEKEAKKGLKLFKRKVRDVKNDISDAVEDAVDNAKDFIEEE